MKNDKLDKIKSGIFNRGLSIAKIAWEGRKDLAKAKDLILSGRGVESTQELVKYLTNLQGELGQLKGSLMKAGQMISVYGEKFLPPEVNQILVNLQNESRPMSWESIERTIKKELGEEKLKGLKISTEPLATASLGQVHRAKILATNEEIILKIQHEGVELAVSNDIKILRTLFSGFSVFAKIPQLDQLLMEIQSMLTQELNYKREAFEYKFVFEKLKNDDRYIVPKVYDEFTTSRVLALSYEPSEKIKSEKVLNLSQEDRNYISEIILDHFMMEIYSWGRVQTDPHAGNYGIKIYDNKKPKVVLYDYGAVREFDPEWTKNYRTFVASCLKESPSELEAAAYKLKFLYPEDSLELKKLYYEFCFTIVEPFIFNSSKFWTDGVYDWGETDLPQRLTQVVGRLIKMLPKRAPPREIIFLDRKTSGVFILISLLKSKFDGTKILKKYLSV